MLSVYRHASSLSISVMARFVPSSSTSPCLCRDLDIVLSLTFILLGARDLGSPLRVIVGLSLTSPTSLLLVLAESFEVQPFLGIVMMV